jgi:hypothetical protein
MRRAVDPPPNRVRFVHVDQLTIEDALAEVRERRDARTVLRLHEHVRDVERDNARQLDRWK